MAFRLKLVPDVTHYDFFRWQKLTFGISAVAMIASVIIIFLNGFNFGIDFAGGNSFRLPGETAQLEQVREAGEEFEVRSIPGIAAPMALVMWSYPGAMSVVSGPRV